MKFKFGETKSTMTDGYPMRRPCQSFPVTSTVCTRPPLHNAWNVATRIRQQRRKRFVISNTCTRFLDMSWRRAALLALLFWKHQQQGMTGAVALEATQENNSTLGFIHEEGRRPSSNDGDEFIQQQHQTQDSTNNHLPFFELHPTAVLAVERQRRRLSRLYDNNNNATNATAHNTADWWKNLQKDWFHPNTNAVYATLPKKEDYYHKNGRRKTKTTTTDFANEDDLLLLENFHRYRHLSRYEREYRLKAGLDLQPHWDGIYDNFDDDDNDEVESDVPGENLNTTDSSENTTVNYEMNVTNAQFNATDFTMTGENERRRLQGRQMSSSSSSAHFGGRFNNYQGVALSQGYGTHYANAWVGSPTPQRKTLIVDTGSHYTAFPCTGCKNCGLQHHTDPYYAPEKSSSFHLLECQECREGVTCQDNRCIFSQSYTEGSSWEAYQVSDKFYCGGNDFLGAVDPRDQKYAIDFMFGCQLSLNGLFVSQLADGIIGMSMYDTTLTKQMYNKGKLEHNIFALCYRRELGSSKRGVSAGSMTLGGASNGLDTSPMIYAKNMAQVGFYTVYVKNIYIRSGGGQSARAPATGDHQIHRVPLNVHKVNSGKGVIVDSGTTDTYLNKNMAKGFNKMWKKVTGKDYAHSPISLNDEQLKSLPTILVQCQAYDVRLDPSVKDSFSVVGYAGNLDPASSTDLLIAIPATNYMEFSPRTKQYASRVYFTETSGGVLGSNTMQGHNVVFDWENGRIGFSESSCTYDRKEVPNESEEGRYSNDCSLRQPVLSQMCIETVDQQLCDNNPSNVALLGIETWSMLVDHPGTKSGASCVDVAKKQSPVLELGPSSIQCEGNGVCIEERPCQLTCSELPEANKVTRVSTKGEPLSPFEADSEEKCGDSFWGACDFSCNQTRIMSLLYTDGFCHETQTQTRLCHIDACGRSDPCRVPFIVHAIFVFRGVSSSRWTKVDEDIFTEALSRSYHLLAPSKRILFGVGDIKVVLTRPWLVGDDNEFHTSSDNEEEDMELGVKVVVQISIYNPNVQVSPERGAPTGIVESKGDSQIGEMVKNFTDSLRGNEGTSTACKDSDLYALAKDARDVAYGIPELPAFMKQLLGEIHAIGGELGVHEKIAFSPIFGNDALAADSQLLSSWTIRTDVDDEINYFGPPEPIFFTILRYVHRIALVTFCFSLFVFMWGVAVQSMDFLAGVYHSGRSWLPGARDGGSDYHQVLTDHSGAVDRIQEKKTLSRKIFEKSSIRRRFSIGRHRSASTIEEKSSKSIELTHLNAGLSGDTRNATAGSPSPKKRRNSGIDGDRTLHHLPSA